MTVAVKPSKPNGRASGDAAGGAADLADFKASLSRPRPAPDIDAPVAALCWAADGGWDEAHRLVQDEDSGEAA
jgi:hypothetical protein